MLHDPRLARPNAHPTWCECRICGPRATTVEEDIRDTIRWALGGLIVAIPCSLYIITVEGKWPIVAAALGLLG